MSEPQKFVVKECSRDRVDSIMSEWRALHAAVDSMGPFADPDVQMAWCENFVPEGREVILAVRQTATSKLVGVVPFYYVSGRMARAARILRLFGSHPESQINEMPEITVEPEYIRNVMGAVVKWFAAKREWDVVEFVLRDDQGWFEPRWFLDAGLTDSAVAHRRTMPMVVLDVPGGNKPLALKRNLKESLRRGRNRMKRLGDDWAYERIHPENERWRTAVDDLVSLHGQRSEMAADVPQHNNVFTSGRELAFLDDIARAKSENTIPCIYRLRRGDRTIAALLTFEYPRHTWISVSGYDPEFWDLGAATVLQKAAVDHAVSSEGPSRVIFSVGVDTAKLRWSENIRTRNSFLFANSGRRARFLFYVVGQLTTFQNSRMVTMSRHSSKAAQENELGA